MPEYLFGCDGEPPCGCEYTTVLPSYKSNYPACPECGSKMRRLIAGAVPYSLKGTGWAQDGYSCTDQGSQAVSDKADRKGSIKSFPGQRNKGRSGL